MSPHLQTVQAIYQAFGQHDIPAILARLSPDVQWDVWPDHSAQRAGVDLFQARRGPAQVAEFFRLLGEKQFHELKVLDVIAGDNQVAVELLADFTYTGGERVRDEQIHLWSFGADGKVTRFRHYVDTARHIQAAGAEMPAAAMA